MTESLDPSTKLNLAYWMRLTRTLDDAIMAMWKQGRGVGGTFSGKGHEAIAVGAGYAMGEDDLVAPMHRDLGCYLVRGMTPERIVANQLGKAMGVTEGRDANLHGLGDLTLNLIGFVSHLPQSMPAALGAAMAFQYREEPRVALTFVGDGSSNTGLFHETLNLAAVQRAPFVVMVENNQYAYSTPLEQQMVIEDIVVRAAAHGVHGEVVDGNDVAQVYRAVSAAAARARRGEGPSLIEAKTMRMLGHAIHDGAEYVPRQLLEEWAERDPVSTWEDKLVAEGLLSHEMLERLHTECREEIEEAIKQAEKAPLPDPETVTHGVYAP